jgi:hypothetical protein
VFIIYDSITSNINNAGLQLIAIELNKGFFTLPKVYVNYADVFNLNKTAKL